MEKQYALNASGTVKEKYTFEYDSLGRLIYSTEYEGSNTVLQRIYQTYGKSKLLSFGDQYKRSWKRTEDSIVTEWKEHNRYSRWSDSARHTDFDTEEEGKGFFYFAWKAFSRAFL